MKPNKSSSAPRPEARSSPKRANSHESGFEALAALQGDEPPATDEEQVAIAELETFAKSCLPHYIRHPFNDMHRYLFLRRVRKISLPLDERRGQIDVILAPRGAAKSTLMALVFPIHALVNGLDRFVVILSATQRQARARLRNIRNALRDAPSLAEKCPALEGRWSRDNADTLEIGDFRIDAISGASELRGLSFGPWRPTWIILDDIEEGSRIANPRYREKLSLWLHEVVDYLGDAYTNIDLIGTLLHRDALPRRMAERPDVRFRIFRSIESESSAPELWRRWAGIVQDLGSSTRLEDARRFFEERREAMLEGARVLWPEKEDYYDLQLMRLSQGPTAFNKEKQNMPPVEGGGCFDMNQLRQFALMNDAIVPVEGDLPPGAPDEAIVSIRDLTVYGFLDPAKGKGRDRSGTAQLDFAAIATVGMDQKGRLFVLDVWLERAPVSRQVLKAFDLHARWNYVRFGIETNAFQFMLIDQLEHERAERRARGETSDLPVHPVERRDNKEQRIMRLEGRVAGGGVFFSRDLPGEFFDQLEAFPEGNHDDGPDAVEGAVSLARKGRPRQTRNIEVHAPLRMGSRGF